MPQSAPQTRRSTRLPVQHRAAVAAPTSYDQAARTVDLTASAGTGVKRYGWDGPYVEELQVDDSAVGLERVDAGQCPLLDAHSYWSVNDQLGRVMGARIEGGQLITTVLFADSDRGREIEARVAAGELRGVSVGYRVNEMVLAGQTDGVPIYRVTSWDLLEVSLVPVPADSAAGVRSADREHPCVILQQREVRAMTPEEQAAADAAAREQQEATRREPVRPAPEQVRQPDANAVRMTAVEALDFAADARAFGVEDAQVRTWTETLTPEAARSALLRAAADRQRSQAPLTAAHSTIRITQDARDTMRSAMESALLHRHKPQHALTEPGREWRGMSLLEMARANLEANGHKVRGLGRREVADLSLRAHSTSDFPAVLANVANKTLRDGYASATQTFKAWMRRTTIADFKPVSRVQMGGAPSFLLVPEGGEFKMGTIGDGKEMYALATYGRRFSITRQVMINDDLGAFTRIPEMWGRAAADFESDTAYTPLIANPNMSDGNALFSSAHGNLGASGGAIGETTVQAGEVSMGKQVGLEGRLINVNPKFLIVSSKNKVPAQKLLTAVQATQTSGVNVYANSMELVVEARLNRTAGAEPWFMAADYNQVDTIEYAYLEGDDGVFLDERMGFEVDGIEYKARLDFAVKAIDWRGLYEDPGL